MDLIRAAQPGSEPEVPRVAAPTEGELSIATAAHLGALSGLVVPLANVAVPAVFWAMQLHRPPTRSDWPSTQSDRPPTRSDGAVPFAVHHAREAFRFHLLMGLVQLLLLAAAEARPRGLFEVACWLLGLAWIGAFLVLTVRAARSAHAGELDTYPWPGRGETRPAA